MRKPLRSLALLVLTVALAACGADDPPQTENVTPNQNQTNQNQTNQNQEELEPELSADSSLTLTAQVEDSVTGSLALANLGTADLEVGLTTDADWLSLDVTSIAIEPDGEETVEVTATCPADAGEYTGSVELTTNEADRDSFTVGVTLNCTALPPASLTVEILGLPAGLDGDVGVMGPPPFTEDLTATSTLEVPPGDYEIFAATVGDDAQYAPLEATQTVSLEPDAEATITVEYEVITGSLFVSFADLPSGVDGEATITGPEGYEETISGDDTLTDLLPGQYEITPADVEDPPATYTADPVTIEVVSDATAEAIITYGVILGDLAVDVQGLPPGTTAVITLERDADTWIVPPSGELTDLEPGLYTLQPEDVAVGGENYAASEVDVTIESGTEVTATIQYILDPGQLEVTVLGLPAGVNHSIEVVASDGSSVTLPQSGEMAALEPGTYTLTPANVIVGLATYTAAPVDVTIESLELTEETITYELIPGEWDVEITGLPGGLTPSVQLTGPGTSTTLTANASFDDLTPGTYTLAPNDVIAGDSTYRASGATVDISSGANAGTTITYAVVPGTLAIEISGLGGLEGEVEIYDSEGDLVTTVNSSELVSGLDPGTYTIQPLPVQDGPTRYEANTVDRDVLSGATTTVNVNYVAVPGGLIVDASGLPSGLGLSAEVSGPGGYSQSLTSATTLTDLTPGDYTVEFDEVEQSGAIYRPADDSLERLVESDQSPVASTEYTVVPGDLAVSFDLPSSTPVDLEVQDAGGTVVASGQFTDGQTLNVDDLDPDTYELVLTSAYEDQWGNEYVGLQGLGSITVNSEATASRTVSALSPTVVYNEGDSGDGSLREVIGRVNADSVITFADGVEFIEVSSEIEITGPIVINGPDDWVQISGGGSTRIFQIRDDAATHMERVHLTSGFIDQGTDTIHGGGAIRTASDLTVRDAIFSDNISSSGGGAIYATSGTHVTLIDVYGSHNESLDWDGGFLFARDATLERVELVNNQAWWWGGAVYHGTGQVSVTDSIFRDNISRTGGAIYSGGTLIVDRSLFEGNEANHPEHGGNDGGAVRTSTAVIENSTFVNNFAVRDGGGIFVAFGNLGLAFSTFVGNEASTGPGLHTSSTTSQVRGSLFADNGTATQDDAHGPFSSQGYNLFSKLDSADPTLQTTDIVGTQASPEDGGLQFFGYHGSPVKTYSLSDSSQALDEIPASACNLSSGFSAEWDQRGFVRPVNGTCSIGAWQYQTAFTNFESLSLTNQYVSGSYTTAHGQVFDYTQARGNGSTDLDEAGITIRREGTISTTFSGGLDRFSLQYREGFGNSDARHFEVVIDDVVVYTSPVFGNQSGGSDDVYTVVFDDLGLSGNVDVVINHLGASSTTGQIVFGNFYWE